MLGKRSRSDIAGAMFKKARKAIQARPHKRTPKSGRFEGMRNGVATSGSDAAEIKNFDNVQAPTVVSTTSPFVASTCGNISEGTSDNQRVGMKIQLKSLEVEMNVLALFGSGAGPASLPVFIDVMAVWDKQPNQGVATASTIWSSTNTNLAWLSTQMTERFVVLRRERIRFDPVSQLSQSVVWHIPLDMSVKFPDGTAPPNSNDILITALTTAITPSGTTIGTDINYIARVKYTDA